MEMKNKLKRTMRNIVDTASIVGTIAGVILVIGSATIGVRALQEVAQKKILNETRKEYRATLKGRGSLQMAQTKGYLEYGDFEFEDGNCIRLYDAQRVLQGKVFPNSRLPYNGIGKTYDLKTIGSDKVGYDVLEAKLVK